MQEESNKRGSTGILLFDDDTNWKLTNKRCRPRLLQNTRHDSVLLPGA